MATPIYDIYPKEYDSLVSPVNALYDSFFIKHISTSRDSVLDVGCGSGRLLALLATHFKKSCGLDASKELVKIAKVRCSRSEITLGDANHLPYPNELFDYVVSQNVLHHTRREVAVEEIKRVLKPGGRIVITEVVSLKYGLRKSLEKIYYRELKRTLPMLMKYGLNKMKEINNFIYNDAWQAHMETEKPNRLSREKLKKYYSQVLPGAKFGTINYLIDYVIWDKDKR